MIGNSFRAMTKELGNGPKALVVIGMLAVSMLPFSAGLAATPEARPASMAQNDGVIREQIYDALNADPTYFFRHVDVQVRDGVVVLSGFVWSTPSLYRAEQIASRTQGVTRVIDLMELERDGVAPHA